MDTTILQTINNLTHFSYMSGLAIVLATYLLFFMVLFMLVFVIWGKTTEDKKLRLKIFMLAVVSGIFARFFLAEVIRFFYDRPRPFEIINGVNQVITHTTGGSFPSGHTTFAFAFAGLIYAYYPKLGVFLFILSGLIGLGRVMAGVHYPTDILGGVLIGLFSALFIKNVYIRLAGLDRKWNNKGI